MKPLNKIIITIGLLSLALNASDSTLANISFNKDKDGNLNPEIFIPFYYGDAKKLYSGIGYSSSNQKEIDKLDGFSDSKSASISSGKKLSLNYISYKRSIFTFGLHSEFIKIDNNEFGYIHDSDNLFANGSDYYISFDNEIKLDIKRHGLSLDVLFGFGIFSSRLSSKVYPYSTIDVTQSTIFKPLVKKTGASSSKTSQKTSYNIKYEIVTKTSFLVNLGLIADYDYLPLKYDIAQIARDGTDYKFQTSNIDIDEITTTYTARLILNKEVFGGLNPFIGLSKVYSDTKNNKTNKTESTNQNITSFGFEKRF